MLDIATNQLKALPEEVKPPVSALVWSKGAEKYEQISQGLADAIDHAIDRLQAPAGSKILDLATGTGLTARKLAERGHPVLATDIAPGMIGVAWRLAKARNLDIDFDVADATALPYADATFNAVVSTFGIMFAPAHKAVAQELARITKPGATVLLANWQPESTVHQMFKIFGAFQRDAGPTPKSLPFDWGNQAYVTGLLDDQFDLTFETGTSFYHEPSSEAAWTTFATGYGPTKSLVESLSADETQQVRRIFMDLHEEFKTEMGVRVPRHYLIVRAVRR